VLARALIKAYYASAEFQFPKHIRDLNRRHVRVVTADNRWVKLNKYRSRINFNALRKLCVFIAPIHVYMSVLKFLFPERVGKKYKAKYAVPLNGDFVVDVDSYLLRHPHLHSSRRSCNECIRASKSLTIQTCEQIEQYYSKISITFSGRRGFHIWVSDFNLRDWTHYNERNPIKSHEVARFKFTKLLSAQTECFDRSHFILSVDPLRLMAVPSSLNAETSLICYHIGTRKDLERTATFQIIENASASKYIYSYPEPNENGIFKLHKRGL